MDSISNSNEMKVTSIAGKSENLLALATVNGKQYINKENTVNLTLEGLDENYSKSTLTAEKIVVKVGGTIVAPTTKILSTPTIASNGKGISYNLTLGGIPGNGTLNVEIAEGTLEDKAVNKNILTKFDLEIVLDNTPPTVSITPNGANAMHQIDEIDTTEPENFSISSSNITKNSFKISAKTTDTQSSIAKYKYYYKKQEDISYFEVETKQETFDFTKMDTGTYYKVYVEAEDTAGNIKKSSNELTIRTLYEYIFVLPEIQKGSFNKGSAGTFGENSGITLTGTGTNESGTVQVLSTMPRWYKSIDFSKYNKLSFYARKTTVHGSIGVSIGNTRAYEYYYSGLTINEWKYFEIDVSAYTGNQVMSLLGGYFFDNTGDSNSNTQYYDIRLSE